MHPGVELDRLLVFLFSDPECTTGGRDRNVEDFGNLLTRGSTVLELLPLLLFFGDPSPLDQGQGLVVDGKSELGGRSEGDEGADFVTDRVPLFTDQISNGPASMTAKVEEDPFEDLGYCEGEGGLFCGRRGGGGSGSCDNNGRRGGEEFVVEARSSGFP